jgi:hypothetical protein
MPAVKSKSVTSIGSASQTALSNEIKAVLRKKSSDPELDEEISSSPLNDDQLELIRPYLEGKDTDGDDSDSDDDDSLATNDEELNGSETASQKTTNSSDIERLKLTKTKSLGELEPTVISRAKPAVPPKIQRSNPVSNSNKRESQENIVNHNSNGNTVSNEPISSKPKSHRSVLNAKKEALYSEYAYLCKIPIQHNKTSSEEQIKEQDENELNSSMANISLNDSTTSSSTTNSNSNIYKWSREYLVLYSDNTIGVFPSNNVTFVFLLLLANFRFLGFIYLNLMN